MVTRLADLSHRALCAPSTYANAQRLAGGSSRFFGASAPSPGASLDDGTTPVKVTLPESVPDSVEPREAAPRARSIGSLDQFAFAGGGVKRPCVDGQPAQVVTMSVAAEDAAACAAAAAERRPPSAAEAPQPKRRRAAIIDDSDDDEDDDAVGQGVAATAAAVARPQRHVVIIDSDEDVDEAGGGGRGGGGGDRGDGLDAPPCQSEGVIIEESDAAPERDPVEELLSTVTSMTTGLKAAVGMRSAGVRDQGVCLTDSGGGGAFARITQEDIWEAVEPPLDELEDAQHTAPKLSSWQLVGVNYLCVLDEQGTRGAVLADEMGLGKTAQAATFLGLITKRRMERDGASLPHVVVCPASVLSNWERELERFCPALDVQVFHGPNRAIIKNTAREMKASRPNAPMGFDVLLTTYSIFESTSMEAKDDRGWLKRCNWGVVVMDEAHMLKDSTSQRFRNLFRAVTRGATNRLMLSGTPLQNNLKELHSMLYMLLPDVFEGMGEVFDEVAEGEEESGNSGALSERIRKILAPLVLRRLKQDVLTQLPPKVHKVEHVQLEPSQAETYSQLLAEARGAKGGKAKMSSANAKKWFTILRKAANHPLLLRRHFTDQKTLELAQQLSPAGAFSPDSRILPPERILQEIETWSDYDLSKLCANYSSLPAARGGILPQSTVLGSAKCRFLAKLLPELKAGGHRPLIFSQWTQVMDLLEVLLNHLGLAYLRLDGSTTVSERQSLVDLYNSEKSNYFAFLLSTRAGGQGLNLVGADTVIIHDVDFNPQMDRQAEDRAHRIGQKRPVTIYRLVAEGTVDASIYRLAERKKELSDNILDQGKKKNDGEAATAAAIMDEVLGGV